MVLSREQDALSTNEADHEAAPLLVRGHTHRRAATPLPLLQLLILAVVRLAEPISFSQARLQGLLFNYRAHADTVDWNTDIPIYQPGCGLIAIC